MGPGAGSRRMRLAAGLVLALVLSGCASVVPGAVDPASVAAPREPIVVLAHLDTGINPYARAFRDDSPLGYAHPSTYIPGYPPDAPALVLSLNESDWATAFEKDAAAWDAVEPDTLYWIPGTRIVGAVSFDAGGTNCPPLGTPPFTYVNGDCPEHRILDDHGHGTMTASRAAASEHSLCPACRIVSIEGPGAEAVRWAADQGWIDVQTNSWLSFVPPPASGAVDGISPAFAYAAERMAVVSASGNGAAYIMGFAPTPTYVLDTAAAGVVLVGAHDNGKVAAWSGAPPHVVTDGFGGPTALRDRIEDIVPHPVSCCTSAAAPYAAGGAAALVLEARRILGDAGVGLRGDAIALGNATVPEGPLADGKLTLPELRLLLQRTADPRPREGPDDGLLHWGGRGAAPNATDPAGNPYCVGCWTAPIDHAALPQGAPLYAHVGYGAVDPATVAMAAAVLRGEAPEPARPREDALYAADQSARAAVVR